MLPVIPPVRSTLTARNQTTLPPVVRSVLGLKASDKIRYEITSNGQVLISKDIVNQEDRAMESFLNFLDTDIRNNPQNIKPVTSEMAERYLSLVSDFDLDMDSTLPDED